MSSVCVVDVGTTSLRAAIAEVGETANADGMRVLERLEYPIALGDAYHRGRLRRKDMDGLVEALIALRTAAASYDVSTMRVVGTAALRAASNADVVVERVEHSCGIDLEIVESAEEARLYFEALRRLWKQGGGAPSGELLMLDVGAGATALSLISAGKLVHSVDEHFGTGRVYEQFADRWEAPDFHHTIHRFTHGAVRMMIGRLPVDQLHGLVVTGAEMRCIQRLIHPGQKDSLPVVSADELVAWHEGLIACTRAERARRCACSEQQVPHLMLMAALLRNLFKETGLSEVTVPDMRLIDGLLADQMPGSLGPRHLGRDQVIAAARHIAGRYGMDLDYAANTAALATQIFDQTAHLHRLGKRERLLLEFSATVHDVGAFINVRNRHKHSLHILSSIDLPGLDAEEAAIVAQIARYHRRSEPKSSHRDYQAMSRHNRVVIGQLAGILRLAYALDVERVQRIRQVRCEVDRGTLLIHCDRRQVDLERWSIAGKSRLFSDVFGLKVALISRQEN